MSTVSRGLWAAGIFIAGQTAAWAQSAAPPTPVSAWPVATAPARFTIERTSGYPPGVLGWVDINLPDPKWETIPLRVFTDTGQPVGSDLLWTSPGEPATLVFDSASNAKYYQVYAGSTWPPLHLPDKQAGVWLETREGDGKVITHAADMLEAWKQSSDKVVGRALTTGIFEGGNRFGPQRNLLLHLQGWFDLASPTHLDFAPISVDSAFVLVDGKEVVEWPGLHDWHAPASGQPQGGIDLAPGRHGVDYYNAYVYTPGGRPPVLSSLAVKGGNLTQWTMLLPETAFFRRATLYHATGYDLQAAPTEGAVVVGTVPAATFNRRVESESLIMSDMDVGFVSMEFTCLTPVAGILTWTFDDGGSAQGPIVKHLFARPGMRTVHLSVLEGDKQVTLLNQTIRVHPELIVATNDPPLLLPQHEADIMSRDPASMTASDLVSCFALLDNYQKWDNLLKLLPALCAKMSGVKDADLPYLQDAALALVPHDRAHYAAEMQLLRAIVDRAGQGKLSPDLAAIADQCRLVLARLTLSTSDQTEDVRKLLDAIHPASLSGDDSRSLAILRADLALATGDVAGAKKQYEDLTGQPSGPDLRSSIRRTAKIGQARAFIDQKDDQAAEDALHEVAWAAPIEKLSPDWALTELRLKQDENLPVVAYLWARRLLPVIKGEARSELLFRLADLAFVQNDPGLAHKSLSELLKKFPYSAEAAQAKEKWPGVE